MKVVGINPNWLIGSDFTPTDTLRPPKSFPIEWGYISQNAEIQSLVDFFYVDFYLHPETPLNEVREIYDADFIVISTTPSYLFWRCPPLDLGAVRHAVEEARMVSSATIVLIGPHGTILPLPTLQSTGADLVFRGEPDGELLKQLQMLHSNGKANHIASAESPDATVCTEAKKLKRINYIPSEVLCSEPHSWIRNSVPNQPSALVETSRGCSFDCPFCLRSGFRRLLRLKDLGIVARELDALVAINVKYVYLIDENFGLPVSHATDVARLLSERGLQFGLQTRPDIWSAKRVRELAERGCIYVELGMETVDYAAFTKFEKFSRPGLAWEMMEVFQRLIPFVGLNCFDTKNPDLKQLPNNPVLYDNYGDPASPFIPYPTTPWGDQALGRYGGYTMSWEHIAAMHTLYSFLSRKGRVARILRANLFLRRLFLIGISWSRYLRRRMIRGTSMTRHERLSPRRRS
jgi:hypothetical protein